MLDKKRFFFFLFWDVVFVCLSVWLSFVLRFEGNIPPQYFEKGSIFLFAGVAVLATVVVFYFTRLYSFTWSYVSATELISLFKGTSLSFLVVAIAFLTFRDSEVFSGFPRSTLFISYFLIFISTGAIRFAKRVYLELFRKKKGDRENTLVVGAGEAGEQILRSINFSESTTYSPMGFVDDNPGKQGVSIHGVKVLGEINDIPEIVEDREVEDIIIALPSAGSEAVKRAVSLARKAGVRKVKIVPPIHEVIEGGVSLRDLREIQTEDLLGRDSVSLDTKAIENFIKDKKVLITGAAGSIGSELSRQVLKFSPSEVSLLDQDETGIFNISEEVKGNFPGIKINSLVRDIRDREEIKNVFSQFKPDIVFHAAAYKHVPLMEEQPKEAVKNNVFGTKNVAEASLENNVEKFVFISTDKAVNPSSVMGSSKRIGEMICQNFNQKNSTKFISVRFGNVLDSRGSVIPVFKEQIKKGGPVEVTHPEMKRYFMMIPEAVLLVLQASEMGEGGEVFVLDMGKPVKILDLARELIKLSGFEPDREIPIVFTEPREGEKLFEELLTAEEGTEATKNQRIFKARLTSVSEEQLNEILRKVGEERERITDLVKRYLA